MVALLQLIMVNQLKAQIDPHFSQYYAYPLWLNPALTGVMNGEARINANYKDQYLYHNNYLERLYLVDNNHIDWRQRLMAWDSL